MGPIHHQVGSSSVWCLLPSPGSPTWLPQLEQRKMMTKPIHNQVGVANSDTFQPVNNQEMVVTSSSGLALNMWAVSVADIRQADNVTLISPAVAPQPLHHPKN